MAKEKKLSKSEEKRTAYHEAGHAVAYFLFGEEIEFITIIPDYEKGYAGKVQPVGEESFIPFWRFQKAPSVIEARTDFERLVITPLAGYVAEIKGGRKLGEITRLKLLGAGKYLKLRAEDDPTFDGDFEAVRILSQQFGPFYTGFLFQDVELECYLQWLWIRTVNLITAGNTWNAVETLTAALLEHKKLTGKQAREVLMGQPLDIAGSFLHVDKKQVRFLMQNWSITLKE